MLDKLHVRRRQHSLHHLVIVFFLDPLLLRLMICLLLSCLCCCFPRPLQVPLRFQEIHKSHEGVAVFVHTGLVGTIFRRIALPDFAEKSLPGVVCFSPARGRIAPPRTAARCREASSRVILHCPPLLREELQQANSHVVFAACGGHWRRANAGAGKGPCEIGLRLRRRAAPGRARRAACVDGSVRNMFSAVCATHLFRFSSRVLERLR
mmetsp:Transcript_6078/g.15018  ORF Transcript_6078/g.15018 Transcript_6078/m.15018 type:complete len:208 (+) Transcript_6078:2268-2891(+)